ncbi:VOC family protein, partial [Mesorhizobium sp. M2E.F.Ca.ET.154.01.1.1]
MTMPASVTRISDVCLLVENIERTVDFYVEKLGFRLRRRAEGFA